MLDEILTFPRKKCILLRTAIQGVVMRDEILTFVRKKCILLHKAIQSVVMLDEILTFVISVFTRYTK
jgi:hypothetical protein